MQRLRLDREACSIKQVRGGIFTSSHGMHLTGSAVLAMRHSGCLYHECCKSRAGRFAIHVLTSVVTTNPSYTIDVPNKRSLE